MALPALASLMGLGSGFAFGTGYGAGVRFGYEDVYPYLKGHMQAIQNMLQIPFASSGFKMASGVTAEQGKGMTLGLSPPSEQPTSSPVGRMNYPDELNPVQGPAGTILQTSIKAHGMTLPVYRGNNIDSLTPSDLGGTAHVAAMTGLGWRHMEFVKKERSPRYPTGGFWRDRGAVNVNN